MRKDNYCGIPTILYYFGLILKNLYWCLKGPYKYNIIRAESVPGDKRWWPLKSETGAAASETRPTSSQQAQFLTCARSLSPRPTLFACLLVQGVASPAFGVATQITTRKNLLFHPKFVQLYRARRIREGRNWFISNFILFFDKFWGRIKISPMYDNFNER